MRRNIIIASALILILTTIFWIMTRFFQTRISPPANDQMILYIMILMGVVGFIAGFKDIVEFIQLLYDKSRRNEGVAMPVQSFNDGEGEWDVFISYASEDGPSVAMPLAMALQERGLKVWYDKFALKVGDSLLESISDGLLYSQYGVVILSPYFFQKQWTKRELRGLFNKTNDSGDDQILPVWYRMGVEDIRQYSPILSDIVAQRWEDGQKTVVEGILAVVGSNNDYAPSIPLHLQLSADIRYCLEQEDYLDGFKVIANGFSRNDIYSVLLSIIVIPGNAHDVKIRAFDVLSEQHCIKNEDLTDILRNSDPQIIISALKHIKISIKSGQDISVSEQLVRTLIQNSDYDVVARTINVVRLLIVHGKLELSLLSLVSHHPYFLVRRRAIAELVTYEPDISLDIIECFKDTSYHATQQAVREYVQFNFDSDKLAEEQKLQCMNILENFCNARNVSEISYKKNMNLINVLKED